MKSCEFGLKMSQFENASISKRSDLEKKQNGSFSGYT